MNINFYFMRKLWMVSLGLLLLAGCQSADTIDGKDVAHLSLDLKADSSFAKTRAVNTSAYQDVNNYTVEVSKDGTVVQRVLYGAMKLEQELVPGNYAIRAFYGENVAVGFDQLYVEGSTAFTLNKGENRQVNFTCTPANVKVNLRYSEDFFRFYSDCTVKLSTKHLNAPFVMAKADAAKDAFFRADAAGEVLTIAFELKDMQGVIVTPQNFGAQTVTIRPRDFLTVTIRPKLVDIDGGKINGITVTIDGSVTSQDIPITIPDGYLPGSDTEVGN